MVFAEAMGKGIYANNKGHGDHQQFKSGVVDDVDAKQRKAGKQEGQNRTMDRTGHRSGNTQRVIIDPEHTAD